MCSLGATNEAYLNDRPNNAVNNCMATYLLINSETTVKEVTATQFGTTYALRLYRVA